MTKALLCVLIALPLVSFGRLPAQVYRVRFAVTSAPAQQECSFETASAKLSVQISDPIGYPFGQVQAFSCSGDGLAVARELSDRASAMQSEAAAYRAAHPIRGLP